MGSSVQSDQNDTDGETPLETDPTGRFQRLNEVLGKGAYKLVYRAIDQEEGVEVAWNQLRIDHLTKKEAQKILSEIEILQSIRNEHIINFYASWSTKAPSGGERVVFVTELMSSGTLKQYLKKTLLGSLKPKVLKSWCRQILQGLVYLHTHDPPIIHRDLKCDNIFINGNNGQLKIGDLGLAVVRHRTHVSSVLGTPEFMAPELYDEKYDEKVDIYAFGMCVLEMVTKEYPYSECTNQAQIYRKVTQGIKPQSLDHVQDPEIREFINRCLDHDDRTRPSAQELLDSDFLKPCLTAPSLCSSASGFFNYPNRSVTDGLDVHEGSHSTSATLYTQSPSLLPSTVLASSSKGTPQSSSIPGASFTTTTTVDADNKTYHIRSNLPPQTPTSADRTSPSDAQEHEQPKQVPETAQNPPLKEASADTPTLHSHANTKTCSIQVVQYGEENEDQLNLKMICTCPVAGPRDVTTAAGTHEIKFPFDLHVDTVEEVVAEMIREQILSGDDREEATTKIQELIDSVLSARKERARIAREQSRVEKITTDHHGRSSQHHGAEHANRQSHKNGHHRQLKDDLEHQYGSSPTESYDDHYSSVGSLGSTGWTGTESPVESDQGYGTVPPHPRQQPPVITETTFPPLNSSGLPRSRAASTTESLIGGQLGKQHHASYSDVVQHPVAVAAHNPLSPKMTTRDRSPVAAVRSPILQAMDQKPSTPLPANGVLTKNALRDIEAADRKKRGDDAEDVGYTSPYRHGVSSSSVGNHRRSPSVDAYVHIASSSPALSPATIHTSPSEPTVGGSSKVPEASSQHRPSLVPSNALSPEIRPAVPRDSPIPGISALSLNGLALQSAMLNQSTSSDSGLQHHTLLSEHEVQRLKASSPSIPSHWAPQDQRVPYSCSPLSHDSYHPLQDAIVPQQQHTPQTVSQPMMTSEARKSIEQWTSKVQNPERIVGGTGYMNGSNYSSCPEMSDDDDDMLDEDLKILKEQQRQELERMRLQHVQQLEMMRRLKEQKGLQERTRRKSEANSLLYPSAS